MIIPRCGDLAYFHDLIHAISALRYNDMYTLWLAILSVQLYCLSNRNNKRTLHFLQLNMMSYFPKRINRFCNVNAKFTDHVFENNSS